MNMCMPVFEHTHTHIHTHTHTHTQYAYNVVVLHLASVLLNIVC